MITVIIPSKLDRAPNGRYWAERALTSVFNQSLKPDRVILALDESVVAPPIHNGMVDIVNCVGCGHQAAMNAAAATVPSGYIAFLEDDDVWLPKHLATVSRIGLPFVGCSQLQFRNEKPVSVLDFPTASGWFIERDLWHSLGGVSTEYKIHHDNHMMCRLRTLNVPCGHVIESTADLRARKWLLDYIRRRALVITSSEPQIQVLRELHDTSIMANVAGSRALESQREKDRLREEFGDEGY